MTNLIESEYAKAYSSIEKLVDGARSFASKQFNSLLVTTNWNIGRVIIENEQENSERAEYGKKLIEHLSKRLTKRYGKGYSKSNLFYMRNFYLTYPKFKEISDKLSWSHYLELLSIDEKNKRNFYEKECINSNWSVRQLKRQVSTALFERLLLSNGDSNKLKVLELANKGNQIISPKDIIKDPYVFEFLGFPEDKPILESDLEKSLITNIRDFLLELGKGFMYVGSQQKIVLGNTHYYVDLVFYNKILRSYVLIELKTGKLMPEAVGQLNMYLNYYKSEINDELDNDPIGIILCTSKDQIQAEYALGNLSNQIFASKYTLYIPNIEELEEQVERIVNAYEKTVE